jgi:glc operon protein GlcG
MSAKCEWLIADESATGVLSLSGILPPFSARGKIAARTKPCRKFDRAIASGKRMAVLILEDNPMRTQIVNTLIIGAALLAAGACGAQQPNPLDVIPDAMPFDVPYGAPISLDRADALIAAAVAEAKKRNWKMNLAVVDSGGNLVAFKRMDGAQLASIQIAEHKARTAAKYRRETKLLENAIQTYAYIATLDDVIASRGGIPLIEGGKLIGAIGCSGGTGSQDEAVCKVGAASLK